ncbi:hypothetical protein BVY02_02470, partial [bacterium J17]
MQVSVNRVLLVNPPSGRFRRDDRCQCDVDQQTVSIVFPPNDLALIAACVESAGGVCRIEDFTLKSEASISDLLNLVRDFQPDLLILNFTTATYSDDLLACEAVKELSPETLIAGKGEVLVYDAFSPFLACQALDLILPNEAELAVKELVEGKPLSEILGLHFRVELLTRMGLSPSEENCAPRGKAHLSHIFERKKARGQLAETEVEKDIGAVIFTGLRPLGEDLDSLPFPARHLLENNLYI